MSDSLQRQHALSAFEFPVAADKDGSASYVLRIEHQPGFDYVNIRGKLSSPEFSSATQGVLGAALPSEPNTLVRSDTATAFWLGPDECLVRGPGNSDLFKQFSAALEHTHSACTAQNGGFEQFLLQGPAVFELLCRASTLDFSRLLENEHACAQTGFAKAIVLYEFMGDRESVRLIVRRSFAEYVALWLRKVGGEYQTVFA